MGIDSLAAPELKVPRYAMMDLSAAALLPFSVSTAGSHLPRAAEASSHASYSSLYLPPQAWLLAWARRSCSALTIVCVWVRDAPVIGRLETIFKVPPAVVEACVAASVAAGAWVAAWVAGASVAAGAWVGVAAPPPQA